MTVLNMQHMIIRQQKQSANNQTVCVSMTDRAEQLQHIINTWLTCLCSVGNMAIANMPGLAYDRCFMYYIIAVLP